MPLGGKFPPQLKITWFNGLGELEPKTQASGGCFRGKSLSETSESAVDGAGVGCGGDRHQDDGRRPNC